MVEIRIRDFKFPFRIQTNPPLRRSIVIRRSTEGRVVGGERVVLPVARWRPRSCCDENLDEHSNGGFGDRVGRRGRGEKAQGRKESGQAHHRHDRQRRRRRDERRR